MKTKRKVILIMCCIGSIVALSFGLHAEAAQPFNWAQINANGYGDPNNSDTYAYELYNGSMYAATLNSVTGAEVFKREAAGWAQVNTDGFGSAQNGAIYAMQVYNGHLYAFVYNSTPILKVFRYDGSTWSEVVSDGFGDPNNWFAVGTEVLNDKMFVGTFNSVTGAEVWSFDGSTWTQVNSDGFGGANMASFSLTSYNDSLYAGTFNIATGAELWSYNGGTNWTQRASGGFGDVNNESILPMHEYRGNLYIGTDNIITGGELIKYDGSTFEQVGSDGFGDEQNISVRSITTLYDRLYFGLSNAVTGAKVWEYDGTNMSAVTSDGFGDAGNVKPTVLTDSNNTLYVGMANNGSGTEMWAGTVIDTAGPAATNQFPSNGSVEVPQDTSVSFAASDGVSGVNHGSLNVTVDGMQAISGGSFVEGFTGTIDTSSYWSTSVTINKNDGVYTPNKDIEVALSLSDNAGNNTESRWSFKTNNQYLENKGIASDGKGRYNCGRDKVSQQKLEEKAFSLRREFEGVAKDKKMDLLGIDGKNWGEYVDYYVYCDYPIDAMIRKHFYSGVIDTSTNWYVYRESETYKKNIFKTLPDEKKRIDKNARSYYAQLRIPNDKEKEIALDLRNKLEAGYDLKAAKVNAYNWSKLVNAYIYGGYSVDEVARTIYFGGKVVHPWMPRYLFSQTDDFKKYSKEPFPAKK